MASAPKAPQLPTPIAPPPEAEIKIASTETSSINKKKVKGLSQLQINNSKGLDQKNNIGLNS